MNRLRAGEWVAAAGSVGLLVVLFFQWFAVGAFGRSGWSTLGWLMDLLLCLAIFGGLSLSYMTVKRTSPAWPVGAAVLTVGLGVLIFLVLVVRVTIAQPGVDALVSVQLPAYLGLLFAILIPVGGFVSLKDERTDSPEAVAYTPPPAQTAPGT
ncbi:MAG: hypothetical protein JWQ18_2021 [Conexibacter sp.]|nr:hypothetical protein [Conexibacter sp.]